MINKTALAATLLLASSIAAPSSAGTAPFPFNVSLDGHCDVFHLTATGFEVAGMHTGCGYAAVDGGTVAVVDGQDLLIANDVVPGTKRPMQTWYFTPPAAAPGARGTPVQQWFLYTSNGKRQVLKNSGTYTLLAPGAEPSTSGLKPAAGGN